MTFPLDFPTPSRDDAATAKPRSDDRAPPGRSALDPAALRALCLEAGADDAAFVAIDRPEVADQRDDILRLLPGARTLVSFVVRMNRDSIRSPFRSVANVEFHHAGDETNAVARRIIRALAARGARATAPAMGFPMEMDRFPGKTWIVAHKPIAVAAGLGAMGIHGNVIHPKFGSFILLGTVVTDAVVDAAGKPLDFNPCLSCKLCVAACPVGAIGPDGAFDFAACYTHNYREFMGGFTDWVETIADAKDAKAYRRAVTDAESASMWQSLSFGANYKAAYCLAVCPAGDDVIGPYRADRRGFLAAFVRPLQDKVEPVYVVAGTDAEEHVRRRFPHKRVRHVGNGLRARSIEALLRGMRLRFQRKRAKDLAATYHFRFTGAETRDATVAIDNGRIEIRDGLHGEADLTVRADAETWLGFVAKERSLVWAILRGKIRLRGRPALLAAFGRCFR